MKKLQTILATLVITLSSCLFFIGVFFVQPDTILLTEMRTVAPFPHFNSNTERPVKDFFQSLDAYIADRLIFKDVIFKKVSSLYSVYFYQYDSAKSVRGTDGWLFLGNSFMNVIDKHVKDVPLDPQRTEYLINHLTQMQATATKNGAAYAVLVCPDKHGIYYEYLPKYLRINKQWRYAEKVITAVKERGIPVFDMFADVISKKNTVLLYYRTDTHWNILGAEAGFSGAYKWLQNDILKTSLGKMPRYSFTAAPLHGGDLVSIGGYYGLPLQEGDAYNFVLENADSVLWKKNGIETEDSIFKGIRGWEGQYKESMHNKNAVNHLRVVIFCDSFFSNLAPFFNAAFSDILYISQGMPFQDKLQAIDEFKPDLVISEYVERTFQ